MRPRVDEVLRNAVSGENMEVLRVPAAGRGIMLLRAKALPQFAFAVWADHRSGTRSQISFRLQGGACSDHYSVVCACCRSEVYGLMKPPQDPLMGMAVALWLTQQFVEAVTDTCRANGITSVFLRKARFWAERYGEPNGFIVVEAGEWFNHIAAEHGGDAVHAAFDCFDRRNSQGMGGST